MDAHELNAALVDYLVREGIIGDPRIESAFRAVLRHHFLPGLPLETVYSDDAILTHIDHGIATSSSSQPAIMAEMLDQLGAQPGDNVLEIGAGTGYNAAILQHIAGPTGHVTTVDIDPVFVQEASAHLQQAGCPRVEVICADGFKGYPPNAPYDRIIVTAAASRVVPAWEDQLKSGGRIVLPLIIYGGEFETQASTAYEKREDGLHELSAVGCGFMLMRHPGEP
ncbi:MAG: methyltransferase domain-containing protein [Dehalococcoidia bacterium]